MKNYINENINTEVRWSREILRKKNGKKPLGKIEGLYILDKREKSADAPNGYCGSISIGKDGGLELWTNGKYQFLTPEITMKLILELLARIS